MRKHLRRSRIGNAHVPRCSPTATRSTPLLIGITVAAAGSNAAIAHAAPSPLLPRCPVVSHGISSAKFCFRLAPGLPRPWSRLLAAAAVAATIPIGIAWVAWAQLAVLVAVDYAAVITGDLVTLHSDQHSRYV
ncbi:hypothetical protein AB0L63_22190 [Nocardia sp. NPDC051990]|uniref:hypothetical protein n=1 Tax=Nocardia sp. NPDC051990 TaxID=3155285 RepID=UPI003437D6CF